MEGHLMDRWLEGGNWLVYGVPKRWQCKFGWHRWDNRPVWRYRKGQYQWCRRCDSCFKVKAP